MIELSAWGTIPGITLEPGPELSSPPHVRAQVRKHQGYKAAQGRKQSLRSYIRARPQANQFTHIYNLQGRKHLGRARSQAERKDPPPFPPRGGGAHSNPEDPLKTPEN